MQPVLAFRGFARAYGPHAAALLTDALITYTTGERPRFGDE